MAKVDSGWAPARGIPRSLRPPTQQPERLTLLDLVAAVAEFATSDAEVVAVVRHLISSGRVRLVGQFRARHLFEG